MHQELGELDNNLFNKFKNYRIFNHSVCNLRITNITKGINQRLKSISKEYNILKKASEKKEKKNIYNYLNLSNDNKYKTLRKKRTKFPTFVRMRPYTTKSKLLRLETINDAKKKTFCIDVNKHKLKMSGTFLGLVPNFSSFPNYNKNNSKEIKFSPNSSIYSRNNSILNNEFSITKTNNNSYYQNFDIIKQLNNNNTNNINHNFNNNNNNNNINFRNNSRYKINKRIYPFFESYPLKKSKNSPFRTIFPSIDYLEKLNLYKRITNLNPTSSYKFKDEIKKEMEVKIITKGFAQINFVPNNFFQYAYKRPEWVIEKTKKARENFEKIIWKTDNNINGSHTIN